MAAIGADVDELRVLSKTFSDKADLLETDVLSSITQSLSSSGWQGPDADQFRYGWGSALAPQLRTAIASLRDQSQQLVRNADEQERASSVGSGSAGAPGVSAGSGASINPSTSAANGTNSYKDPLEMIGKIANLTGTAAEGAEYVKDVLNNSKVAIDIFEKLGWSKDIPMLSKYLDSANDWLQAGEKALDNLHPAGYLKNALENSGVDDWLKTSAGAHLSNLGSYGDKLSGVVDKLGPVGDAIDIGSSFYENLYEDGNTELSAGTVASAVAETAVEKGAGFLGGRGGAWAGAAIGGAVGGPVGAAVGGVIGYVVGSEFGEWAGGKVYDWVSSWW